MANISLSTPKGFRIAAVKAGIKASGNLDLGLIVSDVKCTAAGVFTKNKIASPTIAVCREHLSNGKVQAIFVNAGNANACTGKRGLNDVYSISKMVASGLDIDPKDVLVTSTGIIGEFMPMDKVKQGIENATGGLSYAARNSKDFSKAIMTTDLVPKTASGQIKMGTKSVTIAATAKGSGMIAPNMATMLGFITTDVSIKMSLLYKALKEVAAITFNKVSVDNHTSTNDALLVMASHMAGNTMIDKETSVNYKKFRNALHEVCDLLARQMAADGEGATCAVTVRVKGAENTKQATIAVRAIVDSPLVRTAFNGADPNWGRIISAIGYCGVKFIPEKLSCQIAGEYVYRGGRPAGFSAAKLSKKMRAKHWTVEVGLGIGKSQDFCYTCDLSKGYVSINADYHT